MTEHRTLQPAKKTPPEPLSPELALVDPELANFARERLRVARDSAVFGKRAAYTTHQRQPAEGRADARAAGQEYAERLPRERPAAAGVAPGSQDDRLETATAVAEREVELSATSPDHAEGDASLARTRPRRRGVFAAALGIFAVAAVGLPIIAHEVTDIGGSANGRIPTRTESMPVQRTADARQDRRTSKPPRAGTGTASPHSTKPAVKPKKQLQPVRPTKFSTRVFVWPEVSRATFYKVEFFRRGRRIFEASPGIPRLELPLRWVFRGRHFRLKPATYRWEVRAAFGPRSRPRYGKLITRSTWTAQ
jgi:hypothetical protein